MAGQSRPTGPVEAPQGAFDGVRILSLAEQYPGPYATLLMADLGADVVLVERPDGGDPARAYPAFFASLARNKRSIVIDLKKDAGRERFLSLVHDADIVIEGFRPGTAARLGIGYAALCQANPAIIYTSVSGFGQTGPYRDRVGHDLSYQAIAGMMFDRATTGGPAPLVSLGDIAGGMFAAFAMATALYARERSGRGTSIDVSMTDALVSWMTSYLSPALGGAASLPVSDIPSYGCFVASCGRLLTISITHEDYFWRALCALLPLPGAEDLDYAARLADSRSLRQRIAAAIAMQPFDHWAQVFDAHDIAWSPLHDLEAVLQDAHFRARGMFAVASRGDGSAEGHVMQPVGFSAFTSSLRRPAPRLGEHDHELVAWGTAARHH